MHDINKLFLTLTVYQSFVEIFRSDIHIYSIDILLVAIYSFEMQ